MRGWTVILRKELYGFFSSPIAYVVLTVFLVILGFFFFSAVTCFSLLSSEAQQNPDAPQGALNFTDFVWSTFFLNAGIVLLFMTPILTMRAFSEEAKQGTLELILTYPLSEGGIIFGKFAALCFVFLVMVLFTSVFVVLSLWAGAGLDAGVLLSGYIGLMLLGMAFISLGIFISSLTENQAVSASLSFGVLLLFWILGWASDLADPWLGEWLRNVSLIDHFRNFTRGLLDTRDIIFFLFFTGFFMAMTALRLETRSLRGVK